MKGQRCIFKCKGIVFEGRVTTARADDWGVHFEFDVLSQIGSWRTEELVYRASSAWEIVSSVTSHRAGSSYGGWHVHVGDRVTDDILAFAAECDHIGQLFDYVNYYPHKTLDDWLSGQGDG